MHESDDPDHAEDEQRPGKTRTWWHPLLVRLLDFELAAAYKVLSVLLPLFRRLTLVEFKAPTDALQPGDLAQLVGCAFL